MKWGVSIMSRTIKLGPYISLVTFDRTFSFFSVNKLDGLLRLHLAGLNTRSQDRTAPGLDFLAATTATGRGRSDRSQDRTGKGLARTLRTWLDLTVATLALEEALVPEADLTTFILLKIGK